ncbi:MAG: uroporphyrinogen decarboxylase [Planctomycetes bacterium]|nr:uroporphyrinogen decarboxylase [Planctomycetota bacterium]
MPAHRILKAARGEPVDRTPIWLMRQAGRYQKEYREIRRNHAILDICLTAELAAEVSMLPPRQFPDLDAAIIFSDILLILRPLGVQIGFGQGEGPSIANPIQTQADVDALRPLDGESLQPVYDAIRIVKRELAGRMPLIGFAGAPFTLASYAVEGGSSRNYLKAKALMITPVWVALMNKLADAVIFHLRRQVEAGAEMLQLFDSWVGTLGSDDYREYVLPYSKRIFDALRGSVPIIHFATESAHLLELMTEAGGDVIGVDWRLPLDAAWSRIGKRAIQGNLDPATLLAPREHLLRRADEVLRRAAGRPGHIFNLGHGVLPPTPVENVAALIEHVHARTAQR